VDAVRRRADSAARRPAAASPAESVTSKLGRADMLATSSDAVLREKQECKFLEREWLQSS
jgi:hypothetical protein